MTPLELYNTYRNLSVDLTNGMVISGLDIHKYRINISTSTHNCSAGLKARDAIKAKIVKAGKVEKHGGYKLDETNEEATLSCPLFRKIERVQMSDLDRVFEGKGSPEEIRQALRLAAFFGLVASNKTALQNYCDSNIGLDCSGFAGNFFGGGWRDKGADDFRDQGVEIKRLQDISANHAICWVDTNHVVVIDQVDSANLCLSKGDPVLRCMVAESTGSQMLPNGPKDGLAYTDYYFLSSPQAPFKILRQRITSKQSVDFSAPKIKVVRIQ